MENERNQLIRSMVFPLLFILLIWIIKAFEIIMDISLAPYGMHPREWSGIYGIFTMPLIHSNWNHLVANTIPLFILGSFLFYSYREIAWPVLLLIYLLSGIWVLFAGRDGSVHIGASGIVYGLAAFLFTSGILRRDTRLMAVTLLVTFLYGGLIWGVFPQFFPQEQISWEGHLMGLIAGLVLAVYFRKKGPQPPHFDWEDDDETGDNDDSDDAEWKITQQ